jgi:hypothetical protein
MRVSQHEARASLQAEIPPASRPEQNVPIELMQTTKMATFEAPKPKPPVAAPPKPAAAPMVSDDMFASLGTPKPAEPAFDPMKTQKLPSNAERTQKLDINATQPMEAAKPVRSPEGDETQKIPALDPNWKPEDTQILDRNPGAPTEAEKAADAQVTQRLDDSIWRLQEARRILQGLPQKH